MAQMNEVRIRVRSAAIDLRDFTVERLQYITGLNIASIRTELNRMQKEGYLTARSQPRAQVGPGSSPRLYSLTQDPDKLESLLSTVEAFYRPVGAQNGKPSSGFYLAAMRAIEEMETLEDPHLKQDALDRAAENLKLAESEEGLPVRSDPESQVLKGYITLGWARLAGLREDREETEKYLNEARALFQEQSHVDGLRETEALEMLILLESSPYQDADPLLLLEKWVSTLRNRQASLPANRVARLLTRLRERIQAGANRVGINDVIGQVVRTLQPRAKRNGIQLVFDPGAGNPLAPEPRAVSDTAALVLDNALALTPPRGKIVVSTRVEPGRTRARFVVRNSTAPATPKGSISDASIRPARKKRPSLSDRQARFRGMQITGPRRAWMQNIENIGQAGEPELSKPAQVSYEKIIPTINNLINENYELSVQEVKGGTETVFQFTFPIKKQAAGRSAGQSPRERPE